MTLAMEDDIASDPADIGFFGAEAVMTNPQSGANAKLIPLGSLSSRLSEIPREQAGQFDGR